MSLQIMRAGHKPKIVNLAADDTLMREGESDDHIALVLDGVLSISVDGTVIGEVGPGAVIGERSALEGGARTATVTARARAKVAMTKADHISQEAREELAAGHRREGSQ